MKKILTIDGGGIKGVFPASFLASIEKNRNLRVADYFDLIVGTSTGGIIALALGLGYSSEEILTFYTKHGPVIFRNRGLLARLKHFLFAKYDNQTLRSALLDTFGKKTLGESKVRLVVPSANLDTGEVHVYKTKHHPRFQRDHTVQVVDIAMATSAAPTYFPLHISDHGTPLVDGGVWANNPLTVAIIEAIGVLGWDAKDLRVLSLGCTQEAYDTGKLVRAWPGRIAWASRIADLFIAVQSSAAIGTAKLIVGDQNLVRICPTVPNGKYGLDRAEMIRSLQGLGDSEARKGLPITDVFFSDRAEPFRAS